MRELPLQALLPLAPTGPSYALALEHCMESRYEPDSSQVLKPHKEWNRRWCLPWE